MIDINLLPDEYVRVEGTPKPRLIAIIVSLAAVLGLLALLGLCYINHTNEQNRKEDLLAKKQDLERKAREYDDLQAQIAQLSKRRDVVNTLWNQRILWAKKIDELIDLVPGYVQVGKITMKPPETRSARAKGQSAPQGKLILSCEANTEDPRHVSDFYRVLLGERAPRDGAQAESIERSEVFAVDFASLGHDGGKIVKLDAPPGSEIGTADFEEEGWQFNITLFYEKPAVETKKSTRSGTEKTANAPPA